MNLVDFKVSLQANQSAFLFGNGFSMNFDSGFSNIHDRLFETHKELINNTSYDVRMNNAALKKKLSTNYKNVIKEMKYFDKAKFYSIFSDGILFAESILIFQNMENYLFETNSISKLEFGISPWDSLNSIYKAGKEKGVEFVNIEYWTILIYFYYVLKKNRPQGYNFPDNNLFINLIKAGSISSISIATDGIVTLDTCNNGFNIYYRMLFSLAIFNKGKAISINDLNKIHVLDLQKIHALISQSKMVFSLNYDHIIEMIWPDIPIIHLHGSYGINKKNYVFYQSLSLKEPTREISFSDILVGDYFTNKTFFPITASAVTSNSEKFGLASDKIENHIVSNKISNVVILGMNIDNDQHILRYIMLAYESIKIANPTITYCYFTKEDADEFQHQFDKVITFNPEVSQYCKTIKVNYVNTRDILDEYFLR